MTRGNIVLGQNNYGKSDVRLVRVVREEARHHVQDVRVDVALWGDFAAAHTQGNNAGLLATDTMRNTVYALAGGGLRESVEAFGERLVRHFLGVPGVKGARVRLAEHLWERIPVNGEAHDHAFTRAAILRTATVESAGEEGTNITSGIDDLLILKTTNSGWEGFLREQYTTLPDTGDRILSTSVTADWEYNQAGVDYDALWAGVRDQILTTFTDHYSPSMQNTLYRMGEAVLTRFPQIERIHFSFPNRHHILYNLERFGQQNPGEIFHADAEPYGLIEGWVERSP